MLKTMVLIGLGTAALAGAADREWKATISGRNGSPMTGTAKLDDRGADSTQIELKIKDAGVAQTYLWHVHQGSCETNGEIVGMATAYPELTTGSDGQGASNVTLALATPSEGAYSVHLHAKSAAPDPGYGAGTDTTKMTKPAGTTSQTVGCGDLKRSE
jgi:hypothetical protein